MRAIKRFLWTIAIGGLLGAVIFAWFSPGFLRWYGTPPVSAGFNCEPMIGWAIDAYRFAILIGLGVGVVISALIFVAFLGRGKVSEGVSGALEKTDKLGAE